jgi:hypothetical protein
MYARMLSGQFGSAMRPRARKAQARGCPPTLLLSPYNYNDSIILLPHIQKIRWNTNATRWSVLFHHRLNMELDLQSLFGLLVPCKDKMPQSQFPLSFVCERIIYCIPTMGLPFLLEELCGQILGIYKWLTDT